MEDFTQIERWVIILLIIFIAGIINYQFKKKHIKINKTVNALIKTDEQEPHDLSMALVNLHYGKYKQALFKLNLVKIDYPNRKDIQSAIKVLQEFISDK